MVDKFVGFYWTLHVSWLNRRVKDDPVDEAAKGSKTIRYQRELIRQEVALLGGKLVDEFAFTELRNDCGTDAIHEKLAKAAEVCRREDAILLYVKFNDGLHWRRHGAMLEYFRLHQIPCQPVDLRIIEVDGRDLDIIKHFRAWDQLNEAKMAELREAVTREMLETAARYKSARGSYKAIAADLNARGILTERFHPWTSDNVRIWLSRRKRGQQAAST